MRAILLAILLFGIASLILFTTIDVSTLFAGQHTFVDIYPSSNDIDCVACHHRIQEELNNSAIHGELSCEDCHRFTGAGITFAEGGSPATPGEEAHAAYKPRCLDCHGEGGYAPQAPAFNESGYGSEFSAHRALVLKANSSGMCVGENEACLACHTNYSVKIDYSYFWNINYTVTGDGTEWNISQFAYNGTREYNITYSKSGAKHEFVNMTVVRKETCQKCHKNIYDALVNGTAGAGGVNDEDYLTHAPIEIDDPQWAMYPDNAWGHNRYHYKANRANIDNSNYCSRCHNVNYFASTHLQKSNTYNLTNVTADTNSTQVHAAEALWCTTCHGSGKTKEVINDPGTPGMNSYGHSATDPDFVDLIAESYARTFNGDICMGCHEAAEHPDHGSCCDCHVPGMKSFSRDIYIESEPSGYCTNS